MCSSLPPRYNMEFLSVPPRASPKNTNLRAGETHAGGVTKTGGIPDFIWATAGTICRVHTILVILQVYENLVIK